MTFSYPSENGVITNVYNARDSHAIAQFMSKFTPSLVKKETSGSEQHKAFVSVDTIPNQLIANSALAKRVGIR